MLHECCMKKAINLCYALLLSVLTYAADSISVKSPNGLIEFKLSGKKQLQFQVIARSATVIALSPISFRLDDQALTENISFDKVERYAVQETYPLLGAHNIALNHCGGARIYYRSNGNRPAFMLDVRAYNDGVAFRIMVTPAASAHIPDETTVFNLPPQTTVWYHDLDMHYEGVHVKKQVEQITAGEWLAPPATFKLSTGFYAAITEACLEGYSGMALQSNGNNGLVLRLASEQPTSYPYRLRYSAEDTQRLHQPAQVNGKIITPWRVVMIGKDLNTLVNSDIITNLNPPFDKRLFPAGNHTSWIKPGRAVWKYLNGGGEGTPEVMKHFTDAAAALGFEHNILEGFWSRWTDDQLKDLVDYSKKKGVGIWLWKHSKSLRNPASRDSLFSKCAMLGITGLKIDFFDHEAKEVIDLYEAILKETARYHLLVDFHGANKPSGQARTYPNEMVREGVKGMESSRLPDRATHETTIPFTRWLAGPAEYTVLHFGERRKNTTWAHQVASVAILSAPLLTFAANPDTILMNPAAEIIRSIPPVWDETLVLPPSEIGELAIYARRKGTTWFLAVMNGITARQVSIPLDFLKGNYAALMANDATDNPAALQISKGSFNQQDHIELNLPTGGGFIARFKLNGEK
jgi:alpha-glucosidase